MCVYRHTRPIKRKLFAFRSSCDCPIGIMYVEGPCPPITHFKKIGATMNRMNTKVDGYLRKAKKWRQEIIVNQSLGGASRRDADWRRSRRPRYPFSTEKLRLRLTIAVARAEKLFHWVF